MTRRTLRVQNDSLQEGRMNQKERCRKLDGLDGNVIVRGLSIQNPMQVGGCGQNHDQQWITNDEETHQSPPSSNNKW
ncbi:unnamed protein product [Nezara viridula]|uniref:Uncharacterized protein n=1 Tax=Nezara viridula TaxID=85310 RepID=A0A9P0HIB4_NEZVI|nr:unnamed protein product [Nezara viridula]